jgi:hypothetical protein
LSTDRRELLLQQLQLIAEQIPGIRTVYRNQTKISAMRRPAIIILDADETGTAGEFALGRPPKAPSIMSLDPEIWVMLGGTPETVGSDLNGFRLTIIAAVLSDPTLADLVSITGGVQYQGCITDLGVGRDMEGAMMLKFSLHYPLLTNEMI